MVKKEFKQNFKVYMYVSTYLFITQFLKKKKGQHDNIYVSVIPALAGIIVKCNVIPTLVGIIISSTNQPKWELSLVYLLECASFMHAWMQLPTQLELCLYDQLQIASLPLVSLLFIAIPTPFFNFKFLFICSLFTFYCRIGPHLSVLRCET